MEYGVGMNTDCGTLIASNDIPVTCRKNLFAPCDIAGLIFQDARTTNR